MISLILALVVRTARVFFTVWTKPDDHTCFTVEVACVSFNNMNTIRWFRRYNLTTYFATFPYAFRV